MKEEEIYTAIQRYSRASFLDLFFYYTDIVLITAMGLAFLLGDLNRLDSPLYPLWVSSTWVITGILLFISIFRDRKFSKIETERSKKENKSIIRQFHGEKNKYFINHGDHFEYKQYVGPGFIYFDYLFSERDVYVRFKCGDERYSLPTLVTLILLYHRTRIKKSLKKPRKLKVEDS